MKLSVVHHALRETPRSIGAPKSTKMYTNERASIAIAIVCVGVLCSSIGGAIAAVPELGSERVVFQVQSRVLESVSVDS